MIIKIKSCRVQAMMGLVGKVYNRKGEVIMLCVRHGDMLQDPTFYAVDSNGEVGADITSLVLKACPYPVAQVKKSFFNKCVDKVISVYENVQTKAVSYTASAMIITASFS
jgi:hypothetical protein